jgi:galactofuranose transport system ATP-binding protein
LADNGTVWLEALELTKHYGGVVALDGASLGLRVGEVYGLVGANGAGKSTLVKCLTGMVRPTSGRVLVDGQPLALGRPRSSLGVGIASVPQELTVAPTMTVAENVMLGHEPSGRLGRLRERELRRRAKEVLDSLAVDVPLSALVGQLPLIEQRLVMIARALSFSARLVILDEPTATVSPHEARLLLDMVRGLADRGVSVLYVSHQLSEIERLCDSVTVLRDGRAVAALEHGRATHAALVEILAPENAARREPSAAPVGPARDVVLRARGLSGERLDNVSCAVREGEIVGLAGLAGSGARELLLTVCGAVPFAAGTLTVAGRSLRPGNTLGAVAAGVGFLPGDRSLGIFPSHSIRHNVALPSLARHARLGFVDVRDERTAVSALLERVAVRADPESLIASLSGGNQQKTLVARWIAAGARVLLLDDPTAGVDVATRPEIHSQIRELAAGGASVLLVSTDVEELAELADRVLVFERGRITGELSGDLLTPGRVLAAMTKRAPEPTLALDDPLNEEEGR